MVLAPRTPGASLYPNEGEEKKFGDTADFESTA